MKYQAKRLSNTKHSGKWAVFKGTTYLEDTITESELTAKLQACEMSAKWHHGLISRAKQRWELLREQTNIDPTTHDHDWSNVVA